MTTDDVYAAEIHPVRDLTPDDFADVCYIGTAVERDAILGRTRTPAADDYLAHSWNDDRTLRAADGTRQIIR